MELLADSTYRLSTGREFYAYRGIIGLSPDELEADATDGVRVFYGSDGDVRLANPKWDTDPESLSENWTTGERAELAHFMINLWQNWLERHTVSQLGEVPK